MQEWVARNRPGITIKVAIVREGTFKEVNVRLRNNDGLESISRKEIKYEFDGARIEDVNYKTLAGLNLEGGVRITRIEKGTWEKTAIKEGFIIGFVDKLPVNNVEDFNRILEFKKGGILVEGFYADGEKGTYGVEW